MGRPNMPHTVYAIRCNPTGRVYVGVTIHLEKRICQHLQQLARGDKVRYEEKHPVLSLMQKDYNEHGEDAFDVYVLEENVSPLDASARERYWVREYQSADVRYGYNQERTYIKKAAKLIKEGKPPKPEG